MHSLHVARAGLVVVGLTGLYFFPHTARMARKRDPKPGSAPVSVSLAPGQVIEGEAHEVKEMSGKEIEETPTAGSTEDEQVAPAAEPEGSDGTSPEEAPPPAEPDAEPEKFEEVTLANGTVLTAFTPVKCGKCGAQFYAKDAQKGCPAETIVDGIVQPCGGTVGPVVV